jgi:hypothetical protein
MKAFLIGGFKLLAAVVSVGIVLFSIPLILFIAGTSVGDQQDRDVGMASVGLVLMIDGGIVGGWIFYALRRRKWWRLIVAAPFAVLALLGLLLIIEGKRGGVS